jgi:gas vesicle structural protein
MAMAQRYAAQQGMSRGGPSGLAEVLDVLLDKGLVIDAFVRVSLVGIELLTIDARVVVASVDTYLRFAEAVNRLDLLQVDNSQTLGDLVSGGKEKGAKHVTKGALEGIRDKLPGGDKDKQEDEAEHAEARS